MKHTLLIIGASGHGKVVADIAMKMGKWKEIVFVDDAIDHSVLGHKVIGKTKDIWGYIEHSDIFVAIGNNDIREKLQNQLESGGATIPVLIHPQAMIGAGTKIESGTIVMAGAVINSCVQINKGCIINTGATIDHDSVIEEYVHISPGSHLAGKVKVGRKTWLGIGTVISNNVYIVDNCMLGAGAVVVKDIVEPGTYVGVPVRRI